MVRTLALVGAAVLLALSATSASAARFTSFTSPSALGVGCGGVQGGTSSTPNSASVSCSGPDRTSSASASADYGTVGAFAQASGSGSAFGSAQFSDTVRFTSSDPASFFTTVSIVLNFDGLLDASPGMFDFNYPSANGSAGVQAAFYFNETGPYSYRREIISDSRGTRESSFSNDFTVLSGDEHASNLNLRLLTREFFVPLNRDISFTFLVTASAGACCGLLGSGVADFSHTFDFATGPGVFVLPNGVTANAGDYVVNNSFTPPGGGVPEPSEWALLVIGFGLTGVVVRRRKPSTDILHRV